MSITLNPDGAAAASKGGAAAAGPEGADVQRFDDTVCGALARFARAHWNEIDDEVELALADLVDCTGVDNAVLFTIDTLNGCARLTHVATEPRDCAGSARVEPLRLIGPSYERVVEGGDTWAFNASHRIDDESSAGDKPPAASRARSGLYIPSATNGTVRFVLALVSARDECEWRPAVVRRLATVAGVFSDALHRKQSAERALAEIRAAHPGEACERNVPRAVTRDPAGVAQPGLLAALAYELSQTVSAILHNAQAALRLLGKGMLRPEDTAEILRDIVADDKRAGAVLEALRAVLRRQTLDRQVVDVGDIVFDVLQLMRTELLAAAVETITEVAAQCAIIADPTQLQQALVNLVVNALDAMQGSRAMRRRLRISVAKTADGHVRVALSDSGTRLQNTPDSVFDAFSAGRPLGKGLGVAVARAIVESHGGRMWAEPHDGEGTTFVFTLPAADPQQSWHTGSR